MAKRMYMGKYGKTSVSGVQKVKITTGMSLEELEKKGRVVAYSEKTESGDIKFVANEQHVPIGVLKQLVKEDYSPFLKMFIDERLEKVTLDKKLNEIKKIKEEIDKYKIPVDDLKDAEKEIGELSEEEKKNANRAIDAGLKEAKKEAENYLKKKEKEIKRQIKKTPFTYIDKSKPTGRLFFKAFSPREWKKILRRREEERQRERKEDKGLVKRIEEKKSIPKPAKEMADYIARNRIMRREIANTFDLKSDSPRVIERFLKSEEFKNKTLRRYEKDLEKGKIQKGTMRFLRDLQYLMKQ